MSEHAPDPIPIGSRVFVGGTTGRYGEVRAWMVDVIGRCAYLVRIDGTYGIDGPFEDVRLA